MSEKHEIEVRFLSLALLSLATKWASSSARLQRFCVAMRVGWLETMKFFFTYVLVSSKDNMYYIGWTDDLEKRIRINHNLGEVKSTKTENPSSWYTMKLVQVKKTQLSLGKTPKSGFGEHLNEEW